MARLGQHREVVDVLSDFDQFFRWLNVIVKYRWLVEVNDVVTLLAIGA